MSAPKHTPEPWPQYSDIVQVMTPDPNGPDAAVLSFADYQRAKQCVDACAGMDDPAAIISGLSVARETLATAAAQRDGLLAALLSAKELASEAHAHWDADRDTKVGKLLLALAGFNHGYRPEADAIHAAIAKVQS